jgi:hypothetical protein
MSRFSASLAAVAALGLLVSTASGATADTPVPIPASDPIPSPASVTVTSMPGYGAAKPHTAHAKAGAASPEFSYLTLAAFPADEPVYGEIPLMAQTDQDLTTTPYYILIVDSTTEQVVQACGTGTQCGVYVSSATAISKNYTAYIAPWATNLNQIDDIQAFSQYQTVEWFHVCG